MDTAIGFKSYFAPFNDRPSFIDLRADLQSKS